MLTNTFRLSLILAFAAALTLAGLSRPRVASAQATTFTINEEIPITGGAFVPCANDGAGEFISFPGTARLIVHFTNNGNRQTNISQLQVQSLTGVGETTGDLYHLAGGLHQSLSLQVDGSMITGTEVSNLIAVGPGPDNNLLLRSVLHGTLIDGELITSVSIFSIECR